MGAIEHYLIVKGLPLHLSSGINIRQILKKSQALYLLGKYAQVSIELNSILSLYKLQIIKQMDAPLLGWLTWLVMFLPYWKKDRFVFLHLTA